MRTKATEGEGEVEARELRELKLEELFFGPNWSFLIPPDAAASDQKLMRKPSD